MRYKISIIIIFLFYFGLISLCAQPIKINQGWMFQRIDREMKKTALENQGVSWESQYNVVHTVSENTGLRMQQDTLKEEFALLQQEQWESVILPHTPKIEDLVVLHQWQGVCYYKKTIPPQKEWKDQKIWIEFEGAMHLADIWINQQHVMQHAGGYVPFVVDASEHFNLDKPNEILVRLDNRDNSLIPPGKPLNTLDFCYYGGLYRDVNLIIKPQTHISHPILADQKAGGGVFVTYPEVSKEKAVVNVKTHIANDSKEDKNLTLRQRLFKMDGLFGKAKKGKEILEYVVNVQLGIGKDIQQEQNLVVHNPSLWSPDEPSLYLLQTEILENNKVIDIEETRIGIRHIEFTKEKGFYLNGSPLRLVGSNRHMEYPYVGNALSDNAQYRDIYQIKESGFNVVRLGHYPQDISVLDACDDLGLLVIEPIPGWQFFNKSQTFIDLSYRDVRYMVRRGRNHPSVIMWETTLNEAWPPNEWKDGAVQAAHEEYPGDQCYTSGDRYGYDGFDVSYNDWEEGFNRPNNSKNAGFIREYYDYEFGGHYSTTRISRNDGEKALLQNAWNAQWSHNRYRAYYPQTSGDAIWSMYDYNRGCCDNICESGVADIFRLPKFSLNFFASQLPPGTPLPSGKMKPYLFIANYWTERSTENDKVIVYANVDEVEIHINGMSIAKQSSDRGSDTDYVKYADGGNCENLVYSPFTFNSIEWQEGALEAIGYIKGKEVTRQLVKTPKTPQKLEIEYWESGKQASTYDVLIVYVKVLDSNGTLCVTNNELIKLSVDSDHQIVGPTEIKASAGIASFLVKTGGEKTIKLEAQSSIGKSSTLYKLSNK